MTCFANIVKFLLCFSLIFGISDARVTLNESIACQFSTDRLSDAIFPSHYNLSFRTNFDTFVFVGEETIRVTLLEPTTRVTLHSLGLDISEAVYKLPNGSVYHHLNILYCLRHETATLVFEGLIPAGGGNLWVKFKGINEIEGKGFYRFYQNETDSYALATQLEPNNARRVFPSFDEPSFKATFDVTVIAPQNKTVLSNMQIEREDFVQDDIEREDEMEEGNEQDKCGTKLTKFAATPLMSTYILAIVIGDYESLPGLSSNGKPVQIFTPVGRKEEASFALNLSISTLNFFEDYLQVKYTLPKLDFVVAGQFAGAAMENWGLVVFNGGEGGYLVLIKPQEMFSVFDDEMREGALTVVHEVAHQWFGNLVTMNWWSELWLKEGFATYFQHEVINEFYPEFDTWESTLNSVLGFEVNYEFELPVPPSNSSKDLEHYFDDRSYYQGALVIRMLRNWIGEDTFRKGLHTYLNRYSYKSTTEENLWDAFEDVTKEPVREVMRSWTKQQGFPIINIKLIGGETKGKTELLLTQEKYSTETLSSAEKKMLWKIPIRYSLSSNLSAINSPFIMDTKTMSLFVDQLKNNEWVNLNPHFGGLYAVNYDINLLRLMAPAIERKELSATERLQIQNKLFSLAEAGDASAVDYLQLLTSYRNEDNPNVWAYIDLSLAEISVLLSNTDFRHKLYPYGIWLMDKIYEKLGWDETESQNPLQPQLRATIIKRLGLFGFREVIDEARKRFGKIARGEDNTSDPYLRAAILATIASNATDNEFDSLLQIYNNASSDDSYIVRYALQYTEKPGHLKKLFDFYLTMVNDTENGKGLISGVARSLVGREMAWGQILYYS